MIEPIGSRNRSGMTVGGWVAAIDPSFWPVIPSRTRHSIERSREWVRNGRPGIKLRGLHDRGNHLSKPNARTGNVPIPLTLTGVAKN